MRKKRCVYKYTNTVGASSGLESRINRLTLYIPFMSEALPPPCTTTGSLSLLKRKLKSAAAQADTSDHQKSFYEILCFKFHIGPNLLRQEKLKSTLPEPFSYLVPARPSEIVDLYIYSENIHTYIYIYIRDIDVCVSLPTPQKKKNEHQLSLQLQVRFRQRHETPTTHGLSILFQY